MKVLLIQPPIQDFYRTKFREYPLGLFYLRAALVRHGFEVDILDARISKKPRKVAMPDCMAELPAIFSKFEGMFTQFWHFGMSFNEISRRVLEIRPDAVCINFMCAAYEWESIETARSVKLALPKCKVIAGGHHATACADALAGHDCIDLVVRGEGEEILPKLLERFPENKIICSNDGLPFQIKELDAIDTPLRTSPEKYLLGKNPYAMMLTSRGCPNSCSFCATREVFGSSFRTRSIDAVAEEATQLLKSGVKIIDIQDDGFNANRSRAISILEKFSELQGDFHFELMATNGLNPKGIDDEFAHLMKSAGFKKVDLSLGTGGYSSRNIFNRPEMMTDYETAISSLASSNIPVTTYFILGLPTQSIVDMRNTFEYLKSKPTLVSPSVFYNVAGMPIFEEMKKYEYSHETRARRGSAFNCFGDDFKREDIVELFSKIRTHNLELLELLELPTSCHS